MIIAASTAACAYVVHMVGKRHEQTRKHIQDELNPMEYRLETITKQVKDLSETNAVLISRLQNQEKLIKEVLKEVKAPVEL